MKSIGNGGSGLRRIFPGCAAATAWVAASLMAGSAASAAPYLSLDFQADTPGSAPAHPAATISSIGPGASDVVVDSTTSPVDPFGGAGNKSLHLQTAANTNSTSVGLAWTGPATGLTSGTFSADYYLPTASNYGELRLGSGDLFSNGSNIGVWIGLNGTQLKSYGSTTYILDNTAAAGTKHTLVIHFDTVAHTFTGKLDTVDLTANSGAVTVFPFLSPVANVKTFGVTAGYSSTSYEIFFDNLNLSVPEPGTMSLLGLGGLSLLARRHRK